MQCLDEEVENQSSVAINVIERMEDIDRARTQPRRTTQDINGMNNIDWKGTDIIYRQSSHQTDEIRDEDRRLRKKSYRLAKEFVNIAIDA